MSLDPLLHASPVIQIHAYAAILAFGIGAFVLFRRKGDARHRFWGKVWVAVMVIVAFSSLFIWTIRTVGPFSPIHLLSLLTFGLLYRGVSYARRHQIKLHMRTMQATYIAALVVAGLLSFYPGRIMYKVVFGPEGATPAKLALGLGVLLALTVLSWLLLRFRRTPRGRAFLLSH